MGIKRLLLIWILVPFQIRAQEMSQLHLVGRPEKSETEFVGASVRDVNGRICFAVKVISDMEGFSYDSYNGVVKVDDKPGQDLVYLSPDERVLQIFHTGYEPLKLLLPEIGVRPEERAIWEIKLTGDRKIGEVEITILTAPSGAEIFIDGKSQGSSERHRVAAGNHEIKVIKSGYQQIIRTEYADEKHTYFKYELTQQQDVNIRIDTVPSDAAVFIDNMKLGQSPVSNFLPPGRYGLRIEKEMYITRSDSIDVQPPQVRKSYMLQPDFGSLTVTSTPESGLSIFIDGIDQNVKTPHTFDQIKSGMYKISARSEFFDCGIETASIERGKQLTIPLKSQATFATLTVNAPAGATIYLDGKKLDQLQNIRLAPSIVLLRAEMAKAEPVEQRVALRRGETITIEMPLKMPTGTIMVTVVPERAEIELTDEIGTKFFAAGDSIFSGIPTGVYRLFVRMAGFATHTETVVLKEGERLSRSIKLEKPAAEIDISPRGAVNDFAGVITPQYVSWMEALAIEVWEKAGVSLVVCTMATIGGEDYQDYANQLYNKWGIGKKGENKGVLIFNVIDTRKIRIVTGYGVERFITDARASEVYRTYLIENFRKGDYGKGFFEAMQAFAGMISREYGIAFNNPVIVP